MMEEPSFNSMWYAVGLSSALEVDVPFATRLWGEPIVLYRDAAGDAVCLKDVCPHRSAPLSMGTMEGGVLRCFYHGWAFGSDGECEDVPTFRSAKGCSSSRKEQLSSFCADAFAVVERDGLLWVWRGNPLSADIRKLPAPLDYEDAATFTCDTILDFSCDWTHIAEHAIDSPHLYWCAAPHQRRSKALFCPLDCVGLGWPVGARDVGWGRSGPLTRPFSHGRLHDGWIPPIEAFGFTQGQPSPKWTCKQGSSKVVAHSSPNIIHRRGASGFSEEAHIVPIAPDRTRVLLRQRFPDVPILTKLLEVCAAL